jgi:acetyltransferase-like isoleucine patch superfamily enzyme
MVIEDNVFISPHVCSANDNYMGIKKEVIRKGATIRKGALIGTNVTLLANIEIGEHSIIGAGSSVNKNIPPFKIAFGVPVRIIKDVPEDIIKRSEN